MFFNLVKRFILKTAMLIKLTLKLLVITKMKKIYNLGLIAFVCLILINLTVNAQIPEKRTLKTSTLFSDHMVLQQEANVDIWGCSGTNQKITISPSWGKPVYAITDANGKWKTKIATPKAGGPYTITIKNEVERIIIKDVLIGEVWLASGQSNMDINLRGWLPGDTISNSAQAISKANFPKIRFMKVPFGISAVPLDSVKVNWVATSPETAGDFSAAAYFYALRLYQELNVPIGIIQSSIGGTPAEAWTSKQSLNKLKDFDKAIDGLKDLQAKGEQWTNKWPTQEIPKTNEQWKNINFSDLGAAATNFDDSQWTTLKIPGRIDLLSSGEFDGAIWLRKEIEIQDVSTDYFLKIGAIDDMEAIYINGQYVGGLNGGGFAGTPRSIQVSKNILVNGKNVIAIRVIDTGGPGSINGDVSLVNNKGNVIPLAGVWKARLVAEIKDGKFYTYGLKANIAERPNISRLNSNSPTALFNAMINPLIPYKIKGAIWYQGESNVGRAEQYKYLFPTMIADWRSKWTYDFPFYYVQIAPYPFGDPNQKEQSQKLRDAQSYALKLPKTGMVSTLDIGSLKTIHPPNKHDVGERLARFALVNEYGRKITASGPIYKGLIVSGSDLIIEFTGVGSGLMAIESGLTNFEVAGADKNYVPAQAKIANNKVVVSASSVDNPIYVRYAWSDTSTATLFNKERLPAATFSSDRK